jgi:hypothetical protein
MTSVTEWPKPVSDELVARQREHLENIGGKVTEGLRKALGAAPIPTSTKASRMKELRDTLGISVQEAKRQVIREDTLAAIDGAETMEDVKAMLKTIVEHWHMKS